MIFFSWIFQQAFALFRFVILHCIRTGKAIWDIPIVLHCHPMHLPQEERWWGIGCSCSRKTLLASRLDTTACLRLFFSTVCNTVFARHRHEGMDDEVGHNSCQDLVPMQLAWTTDATSFLHVGPPLSFIFPRPRPTIFIPAYWVCGLAGSFLLKRHGEMGGFCDSAVFRCWFIWSWQPGRNSCLCFQGSRKRHGHRRQIEDSWSVTWDSLFDLGGDFTSHAYSSSQTRQNTICDRDIPLSPSLVLVNWRLTSSSRNRVKKRMLV